MIHQYLESIKSGHVRGGVKRVLSNFVQHHEVLVIIGLFVLSAALSLLMADVFD